MVWAEDEVARLKPPAVGDGRAALLVAVLLAVVTLATFSPLLRAGFTNFDDPIYVTENARVKAGVTWDNTRWAFSTTYFGFYYPLTWLSHMLDCQLFGVWGGGHHLTSLVLHLSSTLLLFGLLRRTTGYLWPSAVAAALFAVHPLHVESVAWIAERKDVLSTFFLMLALWAYVEFARKPGLVRYLVIMVLFLLGLMSKSMIVMAPLLMLLMDYWPLGRLRWVADGANGPDPRAAFLRSLGRLMLEKVPLIVLSFVFVAITIHAQKNAIGQLEAFPLHTRLLNAGISYLGYLGKTMIPVNLAIFYPYFTADITLLRAAPAFLLLALATVLAWRWRADRPWVLMGWLWYLGALAPVIGILQVGSQASADRYTYVALIGILVALAWCAAEVPLRTTTARIVAGAAGVCLILGYASVAWFQADTWRDSVSVFSHAVRVTKGNYLAQTLLGTALQEKGDLRGAADHLKMAVQLAPRNVDAWGDLGRLFLKMGELKESAACFERVIALDPKDARAYANLGPVRELQGRMDEAEAAFAHAVNLIPENAGYRVDLGRIEAQMDKDEKARLNFAEAAQLNPTSHRAFYYLGLLDAKEGKAAEAEANYRKAMTLAPDLPQPRVKLAKLLAAQGRISEAGALLHEAVELDPDNAEARALQKGEPPLGSCPPPRKSKGQRPG
jgi:tetratricopeptide (TPR) repeat protein